MTAMRSAGIREARQNLSALLEEVRKGREVVITEHGRPRAGQAADRMCLRAELTANAHREAERLLMTLGERVPLRAADGLHLALAALASARMLVTFDRRMAAAAAAVGTFDLIET